MENLIKGSLTEKSLTYEELYEKASQNTMKPSESLKEYRERAETTFTNIFEEDRLLEDDALYHHVFNSEKNWNNIKSKLNEDQIIQIQAALKESYEAGKIKLN
jgi:hypothetical protein